MIIAGASAAMVAGTAVFMTGESVHLATRGGVDGLGVETYPSMPDLFSSFQENGGQLWVCPAYAGARGITADDLTDGSELARATRTIGFVSDGAKLLV